MLELITDRNQADVNRANQLNKKIYAAWASMAPAAADAGALIDPAEIAEVTLSTEELAEWLSGMKGAYNHTDLNRVGQAVKIISELLNAMPAELEAYRKAKEVYYNVGFLVPYDPSEISVSPKTDWAITDSITPKSMSAYLQNIGNLRSAFPDGCPEAPNSMAQMTITKANNIEKILQTVHNTVTGIKMSLVDKIDQAALAGTDWDKYTYTKEEIYNPYATMSDFETTFYGATDETSITGWSGYTYEWVDLPDGRKECRFVPRGTQNTIYATGNSSPTVYTFPSPYKVEAHSLTLSNGVPQRYTRESTVTTTHSISTVYHKGKRVDTVHTKGYAYPGGITYAEWTKMYMSELAEVVGNGYYYIRRR
ncbi:MAG: hypothetical protein J6Q92_05270 [Oscillospiraceae bacterium]|nr:hypothetical protein [Oscillospiraceae bacterium]